MDIEFYFQPVNTSLNEHDSSEFGASIIKHTPAQLPEITEEVQLVLLGVNEDRASKGNRGCAQGSDYVRTYLYKLKRPNHFHLPVIDMGNIFQGESLSDTYHALSGVISYLIKRNCIPIILGGSQDLTYANYLAYENLEQVVNLVTVDAKLNLGDSGSEKIDSSNFLSKILLHQPNYLFHYTNLAQQNYFVSQDESDLMDQLYFDTLRLGEYRTSPEKSEPLLRNADVVSFDLTAVKASDAPGNALKTPNGLTSDECCRISRYSGISEKVTSIGFYDYNPEHDNEGVTAQLVAQMIWHFIEGVNSRKGDIPTLKSKDYLKYSVTVGDGSKEIEFLKSIKTDRWWMNVPRSGKKANRFKRHELVPCSYEDYIEACEENIPYLYVKIHEKMKAG